jgi:hypothetical protein
LVRNIPGVRKELWPVSRDFVERLRPYGHRAKDVGKARMFGRRKCEIRETQLPQAAQPLHGREVQHVCFGRRKLDEMVNRIEDAFHRSWQGFRAGATALRWAA